MTRLSISFSSTEVHVRGFGGGVMVESWFDKYSRGPINDIKVKVISVSEEKAVLRLRA
ncbi:hypothetical protein ACFMQL_01250 [Nonomuraea fastidiosa]|uniref:hypothetical protein n=1 Tax=Nonomuraea TaxID=83681 RepID=UPI00324CC80E